MTYCKQTPHVPSPGGLLALMGRLLLSEVLSTTGPGLLGRGSRDGGVQCVAGEEEGDAGFTSPSAKAEMISLLSVKRHGDKTYKSSRTKLGGDIRVGKCFLTFVSISTVFVCIRETLLLFLLYPLEL